MAWPEVLDAMERRLEVARDVFQSGGDPPEAFVLPGDLGPLPGELAGRAQRILDGTRATADDVATARDRLLAVMARAAAAARAPDVRPAYIDTQA